LLSHLPGFGPPHLRLLFTSSSSKPWFDNKCIELRKRYMRDLSNFNLDMSHRNRHLLTTSKRNYKLYAQKRKREYMRFEGDRNEYLKRNNQRAFYGLFRKRTGKSNCKMQLSEFYNHFKNLSFSTCNTVTNSSQDSDCQFYPELNVLITKEEVSKIMYAHWKERSRLEMITYWMNILYVSMTN
jgi:hypothetical protein